MIIAPKILQGPLDTIHDSYWYPWLDQFRGKNVYVSMAACWGKNGSFPPMLPKGYRLYIMFGDTALHGWAEILADHLQAPVVNITMPYVYDRESTTPGAIYLPFVWWHKTIDMMLKSTQHIKVPKNIKYKCSALTGRISHCKAVAFTAIKKYLKDSDSYVSLNNHNLSQEMRGWNKTGNKVCDDLIAEFQDKWAFKKIAIDKPYEANLPQRGVTVSTEDLLLPTYTQSAINVNQESYNFSLMSDNKVLSGPWISEKTSKCLITETAFLSNGQFETYKFFREAGCRFDYGAIDLSYDQDPGNLTRLEKLVSVIQSLSEWSADDLFDMTRESCRHNREIIDSGDFYAYCEKRNEESIAKMHALLDN